MKKYILILLVFCFILSIVGCNFYTEFPNIGRKDDIELTQDFFNNVDKLEICVGDSKFLFEKSADVENICKLFENIVGNKVPSNKNQVEGFYEIVFINDEKNDCVILTGPTIIIDGIEYYTNKNIIGPLSEYLE